MRWPTAHIGELAEQIRGVSYSKDEARTVPEPGFKPIFRANNITDNGLLFDDLVFVPEERISEKQIVRSGDVIVAASSGSLEVVGKASQAKEDFDGAFGAFCKLMRPNHKVDARFFGHFFKTQDYRRRISSLAAGANINNLRNGHIDEMSMPLPPRKEQRRIAAILDQAEALRAKRRQALVKLDTLTQSVFLKMFGDPKINPNQWESAKLGEVVAEFRYGTSNRSTGAGKPTLRIPNVIGGVLNFDEIKTVSVDDAEFRRLRLTDDDLLFVRTNGNREYVGRCALFSKRRTYATTFASEEFIFASYLIRARLKDGKIHPVFLRDYLLGAEGRRQLVSRSKTSAGQFNINTENLAQIPLPMPPISLQRRYATKIAELDSLKSRYCTMMASTDQLFNSIQHRAFRGEL